MIHNIYQSWGCWTPDSAPLPVFCYIIASAKLLLKANNPNVLNFSNQNTCLFYLQVRTHIFSRKNKVL